MSNYQKTPQLIAYAAPCGTHLQYALSNTTPAGSAPQSILI
jgi:hypothetical protein